MNDDPKTDDARYLAPGRLIESDDPAVVAFARQAAGDASGPRETAVRLYYQVRDRLPYDPYFMGREPRYFGAAGCLAAGRGFCVPKAALLAAAGRALGIPSRVGYADVRNHLSSPRLLELLGTDLFIWHGYTEFMLEGRWVKATPAFNLGLCEKFGVRPLEFDGGADSLFHEFDRAGRRHMEYLRDRGAFAEVPYDDIVAEFDAAYPGFIDFCAKGRAGDLAREAQAD